MTSTTTNAASNAERAEAATATNGPEPALIELDLRDPRFMATAHARYEAIRGQGPEPRIQFGGGEAAVRRRRGSSANASGRTRPSS